MKQRFRSIVFCVGTGIVILLVACNNCYAQKTGQARIDSLVKQLGNLKEDSNKANLLDAVSCGYWYIDPDMGLEYGQQELALARKINLENVIARAYSALSGNYENKADYTSALKYAHDALGYYEKSGDRKKEIVQLCNIGVIFRNKGDRAEALRIDSIALKKSEAINDTSSKALILGNIGNIYNKEKNYAKALQYFSDALALNESLQNEEQAAVNLGNIANVYADQGYSSRAMEYYFRALKIYEKSGNKAGVALNLGNIGETYIDAAKDTVRHTAPGDVIPAVRSQCLALAVENLKRSVDICAQAGRLDYMVEYCSALADAYMLQGDYKNAFSSYKQFIATRDTVDNLEKHKEFTRLQMNYEYGKREDEMKYQKKRSDERYTIGIAALLLFSVVVYRNLRSQKKLTGLIIKEKQQSEDLLLNILPAEVADELKAKGTSDAKLFDNVTVLFTDFVNFTYASEKMTPQALIHELHNCFKAFDEITQKYSIEKIKTIGDAYLAVCGLPLPDIDHAYNVVMAGIEITEFMKARQSQLGDKTFTIRIGIHSGNVVAGIVGVKKFAYDIWGDAVNTAARMEQNSESGMINISETTYELVKDKFNCKYRGEIAAKNKGMMKMYYVSPAVASA